MERAVGKSCRRGSVAFWAWGVSVCLHIVVLASFAAVRLSREKACPAAKHSPQVQVGQIKRLIESAPVIPRSKITKLIGANPADKAKELVFPALAAPAGKRLRNLPALAGTTAGAIGPELADRQLLANKIEFLDNFSRPRRVCFVVDCSGSMQPIFRRVRARLKNSIANLQADQHFYVIFFGAGKLYESGAGRLVRASDKAKLQVCSFIKTVRPAGRTNAADALKRAMQIRDVDANGAAVIYFLTDGFEFAAENAREFLRGIRNTRSQLAPNTKINTIGFWPRQDDRRILEAIARQSGGETILIEN